MAPTSKSLRLFATLAIIALAACNGQQSTASDAAQDVNNQGSDLKSFTDGDPGCSGQGCQCLTDDPCIAGADQTVCIDGTCRKGCNANVPCVPAGVTCCENQCIVGCCTNDDCPGGGVCDLSTHLCARCEAHAECGDDARCCGEDGEKSCYIGNCCGDEDCETLDETCVGNTCRVACDAQGACATGSTCCQGYCYQGDCCANPDCSDGKVCSTNHCVYCQRDDQCGSGNICDPTTGRCQVGCNGTSLCVGGSVCCGTLGLCAPGASCSGSCFTGTCCDDDDCPMGQGRCAPDHTCREACTADEQCQGDTCCSGYCHSGPCVVTLTGNGRAGPADATLAKARINGVKALAPDGKGNLFFIEWVGTGVRVINRGVTPIGRVPAGSVGMLTSGIYGCKPGPATSAEMARPMGLAFGDDGRLYVADHQCALIWEVSADFTQVRILAGDPNTREVKDGKGGDAHFNYPQGITFGPDKRLYVSGTNNALIRQVALDGTVVTVAGTGTNGEVDGDALTQAQFDHPIGLVMDSGGTLFVGDWTPGTVRKVDGLTTGTNPQVHTLVPYDVDASLQKAATSPDPDPDPRRKWLRTYGWSSHGNIAVGAGQKLYVNFWNAGIWEVWPRSGSLWNFKKLLTNHDVITQALEPNTNQLWLGSWVNGLLTTTSNTIKLWDIATRTTVFTVGQPGLKGVNDGPHPTFMFPGCDGALTVDDSDNVWIADRCADRVRKVAPDGSVTSFGTGQFGEAAGDTTTAQFCYPSAITAHKGKIYVANHECGRHIMRIDPTTGVTTLLGTTCPASEKGIAEGGGDLCPQPSPGGGIVFDAADNLYISVILEPGAGRSATYGKSYWDGMPMLVKIPAAGSGAAVFFAGRRNNPTVPDERETCIDGPINKGQFGKPYGLAIDSAGYIYVGDAACGVRKVGPDGTITTLENEFATVAVAIGPGPDGDETLFASRKNQIYTVDRITGKATWYAGDSTFSFDDHARDGLPSYARFWEVYSMAHAKNGDLYLLDKRNGRVRVIRR
ncbi:MAG: hypothetical protein JRH20_12725 [Deltaproteobacteria bacterium]|nr:hypothetical protein [Deltaproteobacteria bacterium]